MVLKLTNIVNFLQICADLSKKSKSIKAIYLHPSERTYNALSENRMFCRGLSNSSRGIEEQNIKKLLTQQKFNEIHQLQALICYKFYDVTA